MHVKSKYINAIHAAIDFVETNVDVADEGNREEEMLNDLRELRDLMRESQHRRRVNYYLRKSKSRSKEDGV